MTPTISAPLWNRPDFRIVCSRKRRRAWLAFRSPVGWDGSPEDVADLARLVSVPQQAVDEATDTLQKGINGAAKVLDEMDTNRQAVTMTIARLLGMSNVPQTRRMACAIIANALVFHERIVGMHDGVESLDLVCGDDIPNPKGKVLVAWADILQINYWAIFAVARDILSHLPAAEAARILRRLREYGANGERHGCGKLPRPDRPHLFNA